MRLRAFSVAALLSVTLLGAAEPRYVGSRICFGCHMDIYRSYTKTAMGRSASAPPEGRKLVPPGGVNVYNGELKRYFQVFTRGGDMYQSEYALGSDGKELFRTTQKLVYGFGALENGNTYLVQRGDRLFEAPLSYFVRVGKWTESPGFEHQDTGFSRAVPTACAACHTGQPKPLPDAPDGSYQQPAFAELSIGCERCHGPGELHVKAKANGPAGTESLVVNPSKLPGWLSDNICMSCHEEGSARVPQPGKSPLDFRPGTPLEDTVAIFAAPDRAIGKSGQVQLLSYYQGMVASACFRGNRNLSCITCHDPHIEPSSAFVYRPKCLTCHTTASCKAPAAARRSTTPADNCMQCHMPKKSVVTIAHSALTDHRIIREPDEPLPDFTDEFTKQTGLSHLTALPDHSDVVTPEILFRAYTMALPENPDLRPRWTQLLQKLMSEGTSDPYVLGNAGVALVQRNGSPEEFAAGIQFLSRAAAAKVDLPGVYVLLGQARAQNGDLPGAVEALQTGISVDPSNASAYGVLARVYANSGQANEALAVIKKYLEDYPQDTQARALMSDIAHNAGH